MEYKPTFILAGNGPYENRGCEAIVRGTVNILSHYYKDPSFLCVSQFQNEEQFKKQHYDEYDNSITHKRTNISYKLYSPKVGFQFVLKKLSPNKYIRSVYKDFFPTIKKAEAVLSVGGDNYSLDYGIPMQFTGLDDLVLKEKKPIIIWGASVGPFDKHPQYEKYISKHFRNITGIFVRESATVKYLNKIGITENVYNVADPAFLMNITKPSTDKNFKIEKDSIGINLSPFMAKYVDNGNMKSWTNTASKILKEIIQRVDNNIYLIPHVTNPDSNDYLFLKDVQAKIKDTEQRVTLIPPIYNASETKWIISQMNLFAGARTHSTIAALSSCVPTLSFAYSIKAKGINQDIFGHENYCLRAEQMNPRIIANEIELMIQEHDKIRLDLRNSIPKIEKKALLAGKLLQELI